MTDPFNWTVETNGHLVRDGVYSFQTTLETSTVAWLFKQTQWKHNIKAHVPKVVHLQID